MQAVAIDGFQNFEGGRCVDEWLMEVKFANTRRRGRQNGVQLDC